MIGMGLWLFGKITIEAKPFSWLHIRKYLGSTQPITGISTSLLITFILSKDLLSGTVDTLTPLQISYDNHGLDFKLQAPFQCKAITPKAGAPKAQLENVLWI